jgi:hypothetical protein
VALARARQTEGQIHFSMIALMENRQGIADRLKAAYATAALVPSSPWLPGVAPAAPEVRARTSRDDPGAIMVEIAPTDSEAAWLLAIWARYGEQWKFSAAPLAAGGASIDARFAGTPVDALVVSTVSRAGLESPRVTLRAAQVEGLR